MEPNEITLIANLRVRASIRRCATDRKSVQEGKPDRLADLLEEAADMIEDLSNSLDIVMDVNNEFQ